jgi:hypothetical protein
MAIFLDLTKEKYKLKTFSSSSSIEERNTFLKHFSGFQMHDDDHDHVFNVDSTAVRGVGSLHPSADDLLEKVSPACSPLLRRRKIRQRQSQDASTNFGHGHFGSPPTKKKKQKKKVSSFYFL